MFKELFEGKKGSTNGLEWAIQRYFEKKGYEVAVIINYHSDNIIRVQVYEDDISEVIILQYDMEYNNQTPSKVYKETMRRLLKKEQK